MVNRTDEELLPAIAKGDEAAFRVIYRRRQGAIYRYALQMAGSAERGSVMSWLYAVARRYEGTAEDDEGPVVDPREEFESADLRAQLRALIPTLPPVYREVLALCVVEELTCGEANGVMDDQLREWREWRRCGWGNCGGVGRVARHGAD